MSLQDVRMKKDMSQGKLAKLSGVNVSMIQFYEQGKRDINGAKAITVYRLAKALDVDIEELLNLE